MNIKHQIAEHIRWTYLFQKRAADKFFLSSESHYSCLKDDEKPGKKRFIPCRFDKHKQIEKMLNTVSITICPGKRFQSWIDTGLYVGHFYAMTDNVPPYYPIILDNSIESLIDVYAAKHSQYAIKQRILLIGISRYINRIIKTIDSTLAQNPNDKHLRKTKIYFERMITHEAESLEEALQRILFWSSLFWQSQHRLVGIGRIDRILDKYVTEKDDIVSLMCDFYREMHRYYAFKSSSTSLGDTGQIIILGGKEADGSYFCNRLTYDCITAMEETHIPDPKILLRVADNMPSDLLELAISCIATGIGCPLLANDDVIIPAISAFGYEENDAFDYVTSACWEPLVYGRSLEKNNIKIFNFGVPLTHMLTDDNFDSIKDFGAMQNLFYEHLDRYTKEVVDVLDSVKWEMDPLASLLTIDCMTNEVDISKGGAKYNDYGILSAGLPNTIDSLLNIKHLCFISGKYSLTELQKAIRSNYEGYSDVRDELRNNCYFGRDDEEVISLTNEITHHLEEAFTNYRNTFGGKVKFGLSSSNYVEIASFVSATLDGRCAGEPLKTHITSSGHIAYTELINCASQLQYMGLKSNGNVVDFFLSPALLSSNFKKICLMIKNAICNGFYEMQMNVVSSDTLIRAKSNPELFPNLIVRVWGFSAYFNDLPEAYQNVLIERALQNESFYG